MRIIVHHSSHYDWEPVPSDVVVTEADIKANRVRPGAKGGHLMRVTKKMDSHTTIGLSEETVIARIIHEAMPQNGGVFLTRQAAIGQVVAINVMPNHAHPKHMKKFEVECDDGPDEKMFRERLQPYTEALHASGEPLIDPEDLDKMVMRYMTPATVDSHVKFLHTRFGVAQ